MEDILIMDAIHMDTIRTIHIPPIILTTILAVIMATTTVITAMVEWGGLTVVKGKTFRSCMIKKKGQNSELGYGCS